ncbi:hypothetical protein C0J50_20571 [Silurus asotus]|uniref:Craniofacial development protein 2-like n=1 Tax=Silurus asotus TaxID=30991 RepID=A0AAD5APS8_SILAS|nr:hypothetical protein C0J50_20571 [Silurus asotus]
MTVGCEMEEKENFWSELDEVVEGVTRNRRLVIGANFNGHVGEGNRGDEKVMGRYGFKERNVEGQMVVDFAKSMEIAVVNTYFKKKEDHRVTYKSGGRCTQVDYVLCRRCNLKEIGDCKVLAGDSVARQHRMVVCRMVLEAKKKRRRVRTERRIRWWKLKEECSVRFREEVRQGLSGVKEVLDDWATTAGVMREAARKVLGVTSGNRKEDKETWWWNEEVQESIRRKRLAKQKWDRQSDEKSRQEYKEMRQQVKRDVAKAKEKAYEELYERLDTKEGEKDWNRRLVIGADFNGHVGEGNRGDEEVMGRYGFKEGNVEGQMVVDFAKSMEIAVVNTYFKKKKSRRVKTERRIRWKSGVSEKYVRVVQDMYEDSVTAVKCAIGTTDWFKRRDTGYIGRRIEPPGRRKRGRPKRSFMDVVKEDMQVVLLEEKDVEDRGGMETDEPLGTIPNGRSGKKKKKN